MDGVPRDAHDPSILPQDYFFFSFPFPLFDFSSFFAMKVSFLERGWGKGGKYPSRRSLISFRSSSFNMHPRLVFSLILFILTNIVSTVDTDVAETLSYESLFSDPPPSWDESALSANQPMFMASNDVASLSFSGSDDLISDTSDMLFSSENDNDDNSFLSSPSDNFLFAASSQQAGCLTSSEFLPVFDKSRFRRRDDIEFCRNTVNDRVGMVTWPDLPSLRELRLKPNAQLRMNQAVGDPTFNGLCYLYSLGAMPHGVCSSGFPGDVEISIEGPLEIWTYGEFFTFEVSHGSLGTLMSV